MRTCRPRFQERPTPRTKIPTKSKRATSQSPAGKPASAVSRRAAAQRVPEEKAALLQQARLSPEALRDYASPPPAKAMMRADARLHARPAGAIMRVRLRKAFDVVRFAWILSGRLDAQSVGYAFQINQGGGHEVTGSAGGSARRSPADSDHAHATKRHGIRVAETTIQMRSTSLVIPMRMTFGERTWLRARNKACLLRAHD